MNKTDKKLLIDVLTSTGGLDDKQAEYEASWTIQNVNRTPSLKSLDSSSIIGAVLTCVQCGLTLDPAKSLGYLLPKSYKDGGQWIKECRFEPSYQGLVYLLQQSGSILSIIANVVRDGETFDYEPTNFNNPVTHKANPFKTDKPIIGAYAVAELKSGGKQAEAMSIDQLHEIREMSESWKRLKEDSVWGKHEGEMIRKTLIRRLFKYLPKSGVSDQFTKAVSIVDEDYKPSGWMIQKAVDLLDQVHIDNDKLRRDYELRIDNANQSDMEEVISELEQMVPEDTVSAKGINRAIDNAMKHENK